MMILSRKRVEPVIDTEIAINSTILGLIFLTTYFTPLQWPFLASMFLRRTTGATSFRLSE